MTNLSFSKAVGDWAKDSEEKLTAVYRRSVELLGDEMTRTKANGGRVPVDTGNLYRSLLASKTAMPKTAPGPFTGGDIGAITATLQLTEPVWLGYQSVYARRMEFGYVGSDSLGRVYNQSGNHFVSGAIAKWPQLVQQAVKEIKK